MNILTSVLQFMYRVLKASENVFVICFAFMLTTWQLAAEASASLAGLFALILFHIYIYISLSPLYFYFKGPARVSEHNKSFPLGIHRQQFAIAYDVGLKPARSSELCL